MPISSYKLLRIDSNTCSGGVRPFIKNTIKFRLRDDLLLNLNIAKVSQKLNAKDQILL